MPHGVWGNQTVLISWQGHPGGIPGANLKSISHRCHLREVKFEWELTEEKHICPWVISRVVAWAKEMEPAILSSRRRGGGVRNLAHKTTPAP